MWQVEYLRQAHAMVCSWEITSYNKAGVIEVYWRRERSEDLGKGSGEGGTEEGGGAGMAVVLLYVAHTCRTWQRMTEGPQGGA